MVTYLYWFVVLAVVGGSLFLIGGKLKQWLAAAVTAGILLTLSASFYYFYLEQMFVKRWGGVMAIDIPEGHQHVAATWKEDNLWIENYDPQTNRCIFQEYSRGNMLQGKVVLNNCNPVRK